MKQVGYIRTTVDDESVKRQMNLLQQFDCQTIYEEKKPDESTTLEETVREMELGDTLVITSLYQLGKSSRQLAEWIPVLREKQIHLASIKEKIDTRHPLGHYFYDWMENIANMEKALLKERTMIGLQKARTHGKIGGRPKTTPETIEQIRFLFFEKKQTIPMIASACNVSIGTCYKYIHGKEAKKTKPE
ncbi:MAG: recombinase family protein [Enterococcus lemanii]